MSLRESVLELPALYNLFTFVVGRFGLTRLNLYSKYIPYTSGLNILDLGCGPGTSTSFFRPEDYLGIDISQQYVNEAEKKFANHHFECMDFTSLTRDSKILPEKGLDVILAYGLIHHLNDEQAFSFFCKAHELLNTNGFIITFDGCIYEKQATIKRRMIMSDRGQFIRQPEQVLALAERAGFACKSTIEEKSLLIPYSLLVMSAKKC